MQDLITVMIRDFVLKYSATASVRTIWREPEVAFAAAADALFWTLKQTVNPAHVLPDEILPGAKTVICYFVPFAREVTDSNNKGRLCSQEWGEAFTETNKLVLELNAFLCGKLEQQGYCSEYTAATQVMDPKNLISQWSHRHVGYIAGLGSFGRNNMLITAKGCSGRLGSLVTTMPVQPTNRINKEYCLYKRGGNCRKCLQRCVNGALTDTEFNRYACYDMCLINEREQADMPDICGKCLVDVPCSYQVPTADCKID